MAIQVIVKQAGPLPITATFSAPGDEPMYLEINGSVWTGQANNMIGIGIDLDGKTLELRKSSPTVAVRTDQSYPRTFRFN
jgi:hypothetical protein